MKLEQIAAVAERVTYRAGWRLEVLRPAALEGVGYLFPEDATAMEALGIPVRVEARVADSEHKKDGPQLIGHQHKLPPHLLNDGATVADVLRALLVVFKLVEQHEAAEWFRFDGRQVFHPHPPDDLGAVRNYTGQREPDLEGLGQLELEELERAAYGHARRRRGRYAAAEGALAARARARLTVTATDALAAGVPEADVARIVGRADELAATTTMGYERAADLAVGRLSVLMLAQRIAAHVPAAIRAVELIVGRADEFAASCLPGVLAIAQALEPWASDHAALERRRHAHYARHAGRPRSRSRPGRRR